MPKVLVLLQGAGQNQQHLQGQIIHHPEVVVHKVLLRLERIPLPGVVGLRVTLLPELILLPGAVDPIPGVADHRIRRPGVVDHQAAVILLPGVVVVARQEPHHQEVVQAQVAEERDNHFPMNY